MDFNRVESAVLELADRLTADGYVIKVQTKINWTSEDIPTTSDVQRYLSNVSAIRSVLSMLPTTPNPPPDMEGFWWSEANDIERILADVEAVADAMGNSILRTAQPLLYPGFSIYMSEQYLALCVQSSEPLLTADGLPIYTADGVQILVKKTVPVCTADGKRILLKGAWNEK